MASAIDPTKPSSGTATTESVRANFAAAKAEIEALQEALAAVPQGIGSLTMTAGEALSARDVAVLGADLKVYKAAGGSAVATETTTLPPLYGMGVAYNHATSTIVLLYRDPAVNTTIRVVSGTVNSDGTVTLGTGFTIGPMGTANSGVLGVCHVQGDVFFTCWRSAATEMSAIAFTANGTYAAAPQPKTTWTTVSSSTSYNTSTVVAVSGGRLFAATPMAATDAQIHVWGVPGDNCVLGYREPIALGAAVSISGFSALIGHESYLYWFYNKGYADGRITHLRVIDANILTVSTETPVTGVHPNLGRAMQAYSCTKVGSSVYLALCDFGTGTAYRSSIACKEIQLDSGAVTLPGGISAATLLINQGAEGINVADSYMAGSIGFDTTSNKLAVGFKRGGDQAFKTLNPTTEEVYPPGTAAGSYFLVQAHSSIGNWPSASVSHPTQGVLFFRNTNSQSSGLIWNLKPSRPTNLTSVTYMGFVKTGVSANAPVTVLTSGAIVSGFDGLTPLSTYYALPANTISTVQGADGVQAGVAISPTQLMLRS